MYDAAAKVLLAVFWGTLSLIPQVLSADDLRGSLVSLIQDSCIHCHDESTETALDLDKLNSNLNDDAAFDQWVRVFDRIRSGEMPPATEERPDPVTLSAAVGALKSSLTKSSLTKQQQLGRVRNRRLTRNEFQYVLHDLLKIDTPLSHMLPDENKAGGFDTVAKYQGISSLHIESFLDAADVALDATIQLAPEPDKSKKEFVFKEHRGVRKHLDELPADEKVIIRELDDAIVLFFDASYIFKLPYRPPTRGKYKITAEVYPFQAKKHIVFSIFAGSYRRGSQRHLARWDLKPDQKATTFEVVTTLDQGEYIFPAPEDLMPQADGKNVWATKNANEYKGSGVAIRKMTVEGPYFDEWPPTSTQNLLGSIETKKLKHKKWTGDGHLQFEIVPGKHPAKQIEEILRPIAPRAFRRPLREKELDPFVELSANALENGESIEEAIRIAFRALFTSPQFLFFEVENHELSNFEIAARLAAFLWKSIPDDELYLLARDKRLSDPEILAQQVDRMLKHENAIRFIVDFTDQWLRLSDLDETSPDKTLYPEWDELLNTTIPEETRSFFYELVKHNLSSDNLIDSDFAFMNRRLAEHYEIAGVLGQTVHRVALPEGSIRGGLLTQASILKLTANGTVTSPVHRGSWVLTHLLGIPPDPPPTNIGSIEPDTRGTTTIRDSLDRHRNTAACAACHKNIDPPGFALESFDVIGGFRNNYRSVENGERPKKKLRGRNIWEYRIGLPVDASGTTNRGDKFSNIQEYKSLLMKEKEQVARNLISVLMVYATGAEIEFCDRDEIERILNACRKDNFGVRGMIREVVRSSLFRKK